MTGHAASDDDRELPGDRGQHCPACGQSFKYQYLYDDHLPCRAAIAPDPTTSSISAQVVERELLRAAVARLERALLAAHAEIKAAKIDRERLDAIDDARFVEGYDQAVAEIRGHFAARGQSEVVAEIDETWARKEIR